MAGWAEGRSRQLGEWENPLPQGSNPTVQPVAIRYTIYASSPASHTEGDGMSVAQSMGKKSWKLHFMKICVNLTFSF
jgi:hypothetical protein